jgi:hypothetical protein
MVTPPVESPLHPVSSRPASDLEQRVIWRALTRRFTAASQLLHSSQLEVAVSTLHPTHHHHRCQPPACHCVVSAWQLLRLSNRNLLLVLNDCRRGGISGNLASDATWLAVFCTAGKRLLSGDAVERSVIQR